MPTSTKKAKLSTVPAATGFVKVTRLYVKGAMTLAQAAAAVKAGKAVKIGKQTEMVQVAQIEAVRIRKLKVLGDAHQSTVVTSNGRYINVAESFKDLSAAISDVYEDVQ